MRQNFIDGEGQRVWKKKDSADISGRRQRDAGNYFFRGSLFREDIIERSGI